LKYFPPCFTKCYATIFSCDCYFEANSILIVLSFMFVSKLQQLPWRISCDRLAWPTYWRLRGHRRPTSSRCSGWRDVEPDQPENLECTSPKFYASWYCHVFGGGGSKSPKPTTFLASANCIVAFVTVTNTITVFYWDIFKLLFRCICNLEIMQIKFYCQVCIEDIWTVHAHNCLVPTIFSPNKI